MAGQTSNVDQFEAYFQRADVDRDGRISGNEAVTFLQASNLPRPVLAQIWTYADQNRTGFLGRSEFYNALKLVTVAQSKRDLTPEIVKAALYSPASAKIPAPQINLAATQGPRPNIMPSASPAPSGFTPPPNQGAGAIRPHGVLDQPTHVTRPPRPPLPSSGLQSHVGSIQGIPGTGSLSVPSRPSSPAAFGGSDGSQVGISAQISGKNVLPSAVLGVSAPVAPKIPVSSAFSQSASSISNSPASTNSHVGKENSRSPSAAGNGFASDPVFGDVFSAAPSQPKQNSATVAHSDGRVPPFPAGTLTSSRDQLSVKQSAVAQTPPAQVQPVPVSGKVNQNVLPQVSSSIPAAGHFASSQPQPPWPRMTQSDMQKYGKVFMQVDTDRDGKITGEQARNLFLSWKLPREVLKQVWELSDQDNDSMLSLKEFCIALYLMERYREGRPLPRVLPSSLMFDETLLPASGQHAMPYGNTPWRPSPGIQQPQATRSARPMTSAAVGKPPRPVPVPQPDEPIQQKPKVPELEKHLVDQLSKEEQDSLNKKFQDAKDAEEKVADLEKEILEAKQKVQFYHAKMQELVLYKSRCDSRLNEISEKVVGDKREAEALAKKYEEKYQQVGDVASKLSIEEATFRDIQAKKMELYRAIVKLDQENNDGVKDRANQIQSDLEELVKSLNEQCKTYGLRGKPTTLVELPFGWQPGIEGTASDWDEVWDKFEDEGFTYVKELTLDVENILAPPKPKTPLIREKVAAVDDGANKSPSKVGEQPQIPRSEENNKHDNEKSNAHEAEPTSKSPPYSPAASNEPDSPFKDLPHLRMPKEATFDGSPHAFDTTSEFGGAESARSGGRDFDEPGWGSFDTRFDSDSAWDYNSSTPKGAEHERNDADSLFGGDDWGLNPIRTGSMGKTANQGPFFDSVPSTPLYSSANSPQKKQSTFFDSVPSTPGYGASSADNMFMRNSPFAFADSVPSTPMHNYSNSPRKFSEGSEEQYTFENSFSRFDSFNMNDTGPFGSSLSRFDSMRSTRDSEFDQGSLAPRDSFARFDSFRSTADSDYNFGPFPPNESKLTRFDSMGSTRDSEFGHGFASFDDADPFGSSDPFRSTPKAQTTEKDSDHWRAF